MKMARFILLLRYKYLYPIEKEIVMLCYRKIITLIIMMNGYIHAYEFSFFNKTADPIGIAIQFANSDQEPLYKLYIKPGILKSFVPGSIDIPDIKWSFCLKNIYYIKNPTMAQRAHNFARVAHLWKKVSITWVNTPLETTQQFKPYMKPLSKEQKPQLLTQKKIITTDDRSLCKDRHFEIEEDEYGNIIITASLVE